jgi:4-amino-4-deoxy-L-arabinose transferase
MVLFGIVFLFVFASFSWGSWKLYKLEKYNLAAMVLVLFSVLLGIYIASTPYLQPWDERYHALVAKNMMNHPLLPTLYENPILSFDYKQWAGNHIWVHKQPVTLWGISLSLKMFGTGILAVRLSSILMAAGCVYLIFLIGKRLFNSRVGLLAAYLFSINGLVLELVGGRMATDHVDVFFMFFVTLSIYCAICFAQTRKFWWNILCGLFIGMAILCKWLPALIVLPVWLSLVVYYKQSFRQFFWHGIALVTTIVIVALPWQIYIYANFPVEAAWESKYNVMHLFQDLENTGKPFYYYADVMRVSYGELIYIPLFWTIYRAIKTKRDGRLWALLIWILIPYLFFSLSATKLQGYTLFSSGALFLVIGLFVDALLSNNISLRFKWLKYTAIIVMIGLPIRYSLERLKPFQGIPKTPEWQVDIRNFSKKIRDRDNVIIFNTQYPIEYMFHTEATAYIGVPGAATLDSLSQLGYELFVVGHGNVPEKWNAE